MRLRRNGSLTAAIPPEFFPETTTGTSPTRNHARLDSPQCGSDSLLNAHRRLADAQATAEALTTNAETDILLII